MLLNFASRSSNSSKQRNASGQMRRFDLFGHRVSINFEQNGDTYRSSFGGFMTLIAYILLLSIFISKVVIMINYDDDKMSSHTSYIDGESDQRPPDQFLKDHEFYPYLHISNNVFKKYPYSFENVMNYLDIRFWSNKKQLGAVRCNENRIGNSKDGVVICPRDIGNAHFNTSKFKRADIQISIRVCTLKNNKNCVTNDTLIDKFLKET